MLVESVSGGESIIDLYESDRTRCPTIICASRLLKKT